MLGKIKSRKKHNRVATVVVLVVILLCLFLVVFLLFQAIAGGASRSSSQRMVPPNQNRLVTSDIHLNLEHSYIPQEYLDGGVKLWIPESEWDGYIQLDTPQDIITINVGNSSPYFMDFILKVFYNYKEAPFQVLGSAEWDTEFLFSVESAKYISVPIQLSDALEISDTISKLSVGIFVAPEHFTFNDEINDKLRFHYGLVLNFEIRYNTDIALILDNNLFEPVGESEFGGFSIHPDPKPPGDGSLRFLSDSLIVKGGQEIELSFFANASTIYGKTTENFLVISMLDWHQVLMNDKPYLLVNVESDAPNVGRYGQFVINAPTEPGFYEFSAFLVPNPTHLNTSYSFVPLEIATRFTIEVIE